ncbi:hypothetical protein SNEBB_002814 [Seison nebaliae]|nr:hypothetical protein SNEBB_002814 [Seison nebaliae]
MARNSEKAVTALARWRAKKLEEERGKIVLEKRPTDATMETNVKKAEKWRRQIVGQVAKKVAQIQNAGLGEYKIRDLNDEINQLLQEKYRWELQIVFLGGPDYSKLTPNVIDNDGQEISGTRGYKYFGEAKNLPGVKDLLMNNVATRRKKKSRMQIQQSIGINYYGALDEEDGVIVPIEKKREEELRNDEIRKWRREHNLDENDFVDQMMVDSSEDCRLRSHINIPSEEEIEKLLLKKKKEDLLREFSK